MTRIKTSNYLLLALVAGLFAIVLWQAHTAHAYIRDIHLKNMPTTVPTLGELLSSGQIKTYQALPVQPFHAMELENVNVTFIKADHYGVYLTKQTRRSVALDVANGTLGISKTDEGMDFQSEIFVLSPQPVDVCMKGTPRHRNQLEVAGFEGPAPRIVVEACDVIVKTCLPETHFLLQQGGALHLHESLRFPVSEAAPRLTVQLENAGTFVLTGKQKLANLTIQGQFTAEPKRIRMPDGTMAIGDYDLKSRIEGFASCDSLHIDLSRPSGSGPTTLTLPKAWDLHSQHILTNENVEIVWK